MRVGDARMEPESPRSGIVVPMTIDQARYFQAARRRRRTVTPFHMSATLRFDAPIAVAAAAEAVQGLLARHEALRASFHEWRQDGRAEPVKPPRSPDVQRWTQVVSAVARPRLRVVDCETNDLRAVADAEFTAPFQVDAAPLLRVLLVKTSNEHLAMLTAHHVVCDELSLRILCREFIMLYAAARDGRHVPVTNAAGDYARFAQEQQFLLKADALAGPALTFVRQQWQALAPAQVTLGELLGRPARGRPGLLAAEARVLLSQDQMSAVVSFARSRNVTVSVLCLAALGMVLSQTVGRTPVPIWINCANRTTETAQGLVGWLATQHVLGLTLCDGDSFDDVLRRAQHALAQTLQHQHVPLAAVCPEGDTAGAPPFRVTFDYADSRITPAVSPASPPARLIAGRGTPRFGRQLGIRASLGDNALVLRTYFYRDWFSDRWALQLLDRMSDTLKASIREPACRLPHTHAV